MCPLRRALIFAMAAFFSIVHVGASAQMPLADVDPSDPIAPIRLDPAGELTVSSMPTDSHGSCSCGSSNDCPSVCSSTCCKATEAAAGAAHAGLFYENDFGYLTDGRHCGCTYLGDRWKRLAVSPCLVFDAGGQYRARLMNERNHRGLGLTGVDDDFLLHRTRLYLNAELEDWFRAYAEFIDAESNYENFGPRPIEVNRADVQNLFGDLRLYRTGGGEIWARYGRQELLYGQQRLISPLDWGNTRRTFEGGKVFYRGEAGGLDAFYTRPVFPQARQFDGPDYDQEFMGVYASRQACGTTPAVDVYYLRYNNGDAGFQFDTAGALLAGQVSDWEWEVEAAYQFGDNADSSNHEAGMWTVGAGRGWSDLPGKPSLWFYYDWASGDDARGAGNGFHHLFPLAHKYLGFMDLYGRRNIETPNVHLSLKPHEKVSLLVRYYYFFLENRNDSPYNVNMSAFQPTSTPASADLGHEVDLVATWTVTPRAALQFGYAHFFAGEYYALTPGLLYRDDADFFYTEFTLNF